MMLQQLVIASDSEAISKWRDFQEITSSLRSLAQTGIIDETTSCLEPVAPLAQTGFFPLGMVQLMSRQGGQGGPRNDRIRYNVISETFY